MKLLEGKAAVVTGSGRGVGRGHCLHLAKNGAKVVVNDILLEEAQKVADEIKAAGGEAIASNILGDYLPSLEAANRNLQSASNLLTKDIPMIACEIGKRLGRVDICLAA